MRPAASLVIAPLAVLALGAAAPPPAPASHRYLLDPARSAISAQVGFLGLSSKTARFPSASGTITLDPQRPQAIAMDVTLDARALTAGDETTRQRLVGPSFFDVERYPQVRFTGRQMIMTGPRSARVQGEISARGITRPANLTVTFAQPPAEATGTEPISLTALTTLDRTAFGMTAYRFLVGRNVAIRIDATLAPG